MRDDALGFDEPQSEEDGVAEALAREAVESLQADFLTVFGSPQGERVLAYLGGFCHQIRPSFVSGDRDQTIFNEGKRNVMLKIMEFLHLDDNTMIQQSRERALRG